MLSIIRVNAKAIVALVVTVVASAGARYGWDFGALSVSDFVGAVATAALTWLVPNKAA